MYDLAFSHEVYTCRICRECPSTSPFLQCYPGSVVLRCLIVWQMVHFRTSFRYLKISTAISLFETVKITLSKILVLAVKTRIAFFSVYLSEYAGNIFQKGTLLLTYDTNLDTYRSRLNNNKFKYGQVALFLDFVPSEHIGQFRASEQCFRRGVCCRQMAWK